MQEDLITVLGSLNVCFQFHQEFSLRRKKLFLGVQRIRNYKNVGARSRKNYFDSIIPIHNTNIIILQANGYEMRNYLSAHRQNHLIKEIPV